MALNETKHCQGKDVFERMNFLYQASQLISTSSGLAASYYGNIMVSCAKKAVLRMEPDVKRTICKCCQSPLLPEKTTKIRLASRPTKAVKLTCLYCARTRKIPTKKNYKLWNLQPESVVQVFDYTPLKNSPSSSLTTDKDIKVAPLDVNEKKDLQLAIPEVDSHANLVTKDYIVNLDTECVVKQELSIASVVNVNRS